MFLCQMKSQANCFWKKKSWFLWAISHLHQRTFGSNCFHHSFAAISFSRFLIVRLVCIVFCFFFKRFCYKNIAKKIVKFLLLNHSALVNIPVRSALPALCPSRGTSSAQKWYTKGGLDDQAGVSQYNTLLYTPPPPIGRKGKFAN